MTRFRDVQTWIDVPISRFSRKCVLVFVTLVTALFSVVASEVSADMRLRHVEDVVNLAWSRDGSFIATSSDFDRLITVWSADGRRLKEIRRSTGSCGVQWGPLAFDPNDRFLYTARDTASANAKVALSVLNWQEGRWIRDLPSLPLPVEYEKSTLWVCGHTFRIAPDFSSVLYQYGAQDYLALQSLGDGAALHAPIEYSGLMDFQMSPSRPEVALVTVDGAVEIRTIPDFAKALSIRAFNDGGKLAYSPDGRFLAAGLAPKVEVAGGRERVGVALYPSASLIVIDRNKANAIRSYRISGLSDKSGLQGLTFLPNGDLAVATPKQVYLRSLGEAASFSEIYSCSAVCWTLSPSPNGRVLAVVDGRNVVLLDIQPDR